MCSRRLRDIVRYKNGEKIEDFHVPTTVDDYRAAYRGYLPDTDLQDARARWPFVLHVGTTMNFHGRDGKSQQDFGDVRPAQTKKVAACQAWFEYQPARAVRRRARMSIDMRHRSVEGCGHHPVRTKADWDGNRGNLAAINSLKLYRKLRYGKNVDLILSRITGRFVPRKRLPGPEAAAFETKGISISSASQNVVEVLDAGRTYGGRQAAGDRSVRPAGRYAPNLRKESPAGRCYGHGTGRRNGFWNNYECRRFAVEVVGKFGVVHARLAHRDFQNLPKGTRSGMAGCGIRGVCRRDDWAGYRTKNSAEILNVLSREKISGMVSLAGDRHSFFAGGSFTDFTAKRFQTCRG